MLITLKGDPCPACGYTRKNIVFDNTGHIISARCGICDSSLIVTGDDIKDVMKYIVNRECNEYP